MKGDLIINMDVFGIQKQKQLSKSDKSSIGSWDRKIKKLCNKINKKKNYYTTSSCAGRIILLKYSDVKQENAFLFRTHEKTSFKELKKALDIAGKEYNGLVEFQQTSCILHVACRNIKDAFEIVGKAKESGWKRSGIMSCGNSSRCMAELHSTENMSFPIMNNGKMLADDDFLKLIVEIANSKLERAWDKIDRMEKMI